MEGLSHQAALFDGKCRFYMTIRTTIYQQNQRKERNYTHEQLRTDELTLASERLAAPMENPFDYRYGSDGQLWFQGESLRETFENGIKVAEEVTRQYPQFYIELVRRHIELKQYEEQVAFGRDSLADDHILVHISPPPEAAIMGLIDLGAYDPVRQKVLIRLTEKRPSGVRVTSFSLDGNNQEGLRSVGDICGFELADGMSAEDILATPMFLPKSRLGKERPVSVLRKRYDEVMERQFGGQWYAGRQDSETIHALQHIEAHPAYIEQHLKRVKDISRRLGKEFRDSNEYEQAVQDFVALMNRLMRQPDYSGSAEAAGGEARAVGENLGVSDCATGFNLSAEQALEQQGIGNTWKFGQCVVCQKSGLVGQCWVCAGCEAADNRGEDLVEIRKRALAKQALTHTKYSENVRVYKYAQSDRLPLKRPSRAQSIHSQFGRFAQVKTRIIIGGAVDEVIDRRTKEVIALV